LINPSIRSAERWSLTLVRSIRTVNLRKAASAVLRRAALRRAALRRAALKEEVATAVLLPVVATAVLLPVVATAVLLPVVATALPIRVVATAVLLRVAATVVLLRVAATVVLPRAVLRRATAVPPLVQAMALRSPATACPAAAHLWCKPAVAAPLGRPATPLRCW